MKQILKLAWRNIWRNRRRSLIALLSVTFAVFLSINFRSLQWGSYHKMIEAGVKNTGHIQIHAENYWTDKSINDLFEDTPSLQDSTLAIEGVNAIVPRLQNFALAASNNHSKGSIIIGIQPAKENRLNQLSKKIKEGIYLNSQTKGVMVAEGLANYLKLNLKDTIVLFGQGFQGTIAAAKYPVVGILQLSNPKMNKMAIYLPLTLAQAYNGAVGMVSAYLLSVENQAPLTTIKTHLKEYFTSYEIMSWNEMQPEIQESINTDTLVATLLLTCLYIIVGFGVVGTILMMALERKKEFGRLWAIGFQKKQIQLMLITESFLLGLLGVCLAFCLTLPVVIYLNTHPIPLKGESAKAFEAMGAEPIIQFAIKPSLFLLQGGIVFSIMLLASLFPLLIIRQLKINTSIR